MANFQLSLIEKICCPRCGALFRNARQVDSNDGVLICSHCASEFPVRDGVLYATALAHQPAKELRVLIDRLLFWYNLQSNTLEAEFKHLIQLTRQQAEPIFNTALSDATRGIIFTTAPTILVSGVGAGEIGRWMAGKGARVIALDYNPAELLKGEAVFLKQDAMPVEKMFLRYVVAFPWQLPFLNEQFDVVFHTLSTHCPVSARNLIAELLRVLMRNGSLILFLGPTTKLPLPVGNEQVGKLIEPRTYCLQSTPSKVAFKIALLIGGAGKIQQKEYLLPETERRADSITEDDVSVTIPFPSLRRAFTIIARKRKKDSRSSPPKSISTASLINDLSLLPFILGEKSTFEELSRQLRRLFRLCVPPQELSTRIDFAKKLNFWNELGWRDSEQIGSELARYPFSNAFCYLSASSQAQYLRVYLFGVPRRVSRRYRLQVQVNDEPVEIEPPLTPGWQTLKLKLPPLKDTKLLEIFFQQQNLFRLIDRFGIFDYRSLGIAIKSVELV